MKLSDILIIYFACGAPFGVYFFLHHKNGTHSKNVYLRFLAVVFVWIPYAFRLLHGFVTSYSENLIADKLDELQKQISGFLSDSGSGVSVFEFREVLERYTGLTLARFSKAEKPSPSDEEIFRVARRENIKLGAECLHRRNRLLIERHQISAREDFLQIVSEIADSVGEIEKLNILTAEFVKILDDMQARGKLNEIFDQALQNASEKSVQHSESEIWKLKQPKQSAADKIAVRLSALTTATRKD